VPLVADASPTSFLTYANHLATFAASPEGQRAIEDCRRTLATVGRSPFAAAGVLDDVAAIERWTTWAETDETQQLVAAVADAGVTVADALALAIGEAVTASTGEPDVWIDVEGHGRDDLAPTIDVSGTVGWFTTLTPVRIAASGTPGLANGARQLRDERQGGAPSGLVWMLARFGADRVTAAESHGEPQIVLNYLGDLDKAMPASSLFAVTSRFAGPLESPRRRRLYLLMCSASILDRRLRVEWACGRDVARQIQTPRIADGTMTYIRHLLSRLSSRDAQPL